MTRQIQAKDPFLTKVLKIIPAEIIAAYLAIAGAIPEDDPKTKMILIIVSIFLFWIIPFYLIFLQKVVNVFQVVVTSLSFPVWIFSIGGPFSYYEFYQNYYGTIALVLWTLLIPFAFIPDDQTSETSIG